MKTTLAICLLGLVGLSMGSVVPMARFDDYKVYKVFVQNNEQLEELKKLGDNLPVQYLTDIGGPGRSYQIVIDPAHEEELVKKLEYIGYVFSVLIEDLQRILEERLSPILKPAMEWTQYHSLKDIYDWADSVAFKNPLSVKSYVIGTSYEGRIIKALKLSRRKGNQAIFVEANIHAIEWVSSAAGTCFFNNLVYSKDEEIRRMTIEYDWIFVPVLNPDGFEYTHNVHPLWRKNRKPTGFSNSSGICYGTDMNRNFDAHWGGAGWNVDVPCDHWYAGSEANTEPEILALQKFVKSFPENYIRMYIALHAYGNFLLLPYGHTTTEYPPNYEQMMTISKAFADSARVKYGTDFLYGASGILNYPVSGSAKDWAYEKMGIKYTATLELRDDGKYGFFLPASQIIEVCEEITDGFVGMLKAAKQEKLFD